MISTTETPSISYEEERGKPMPSRNHGRVQSNLTGELLKDDRFFPYNELTLTLAGTNYTPDISVYPKEPVDYRHDEITRTDPPLTTVEIPSPSQTEQTLFDKAEIYLREGVKSCWIISLLLRTVTILLPDGRQEVFHRGIITDPATGLKADLSRVFS